MLLYTPESLQRLKERIDLVEVISPYVHLQRAGASYKALCPFHEEKSPSFVIQKGASHYHCFGCGAHGDSIAFLMGHLKMGFAQAVEHLADRFQVLLETAEQRQEPVGPRRMELRQALEKACQIYHFALLYTEEGHRALSYLYERGIDIEFIRFFQIGFAPREGDVLIRLMLKERFTEEVLVAAGLMTAPETGKRRDFFHDRITFPIRDMGGAVIGFSARKFKEETFGGKYINTSETSVFKKSKVLFGLSYSRQRIIKERKAIVVEGQLDALRLVHEGFDYTVAGQGTAFGEEHVKELMHLGVTQVFLALDADNAGREAAVKIGYLFQKKGIGVCVTRLLEGDDPDSLLRYKGAELFQKLLDESEEYLAYLVSHFSQKVDIKTPAGKNELGQKIAQMVRGWDEPLMVHEGLKRLAELIHVPEAILGVGQLQAPEMYIKRSSSSSIVEIDPNRILETDLLRWLFLMGQSNSRLVEIARANLTDNHFCIESCRRLYSLYITIYEKGEMRDFFSLAIASQHAEDQELLSEISAKKVNLQKAENGIVETIQKLLYRKWMEEREMIRMKIISGGSSEEELLEFVKQFDIIKKRRPEVILPLSQAVT